MFASLLQRVLGLPGSFTPDEPTPEPEPAGYYPRSPHDVYYTAWTLQQFLPWELVKYIVDLAEYWPRLEDELDDDHLQIREGRSPYPCVRVPIHTFNTRRAQPVRKVVFQISAHDQGWVGDPNAGTWTWFDALLIPPDRSRHLVQRLATNQQAEREWQEHDQIWYAADAVEDPKEGECSMELMRAMVEGSELQVVAHAKFAGWTNHVRRVRLEVFIGVLH